MGFFFYYVHTNGAYLGIGYPKYYAFKKLLKKIKDKFEPLTPFRSFRYYMYLYLHILKITALKIWFKLILKMENIVAMHILGVF